MVRPMLAETHSRRAPVRRHPPVVIREADAHHRDAEFGDAAHNATCCAACEFQCGSNTTALAPRFHRGLPENSAPDGIVLAIRVGRRR